MVIIRPKKTTLNEDHNECRFPSCGYLALTRKANSAVLGRYQKPCSPHFARHKTLIETFTYLLCLLHTRYTYTGTVLHLGAPVRPPTLRSRPHGRPLRAAASLSVSPSLPRSLRSFPTFTMRETERERRDGRKITHGAVAVILYTNACDPCALVGLLGEAKLGLGGIINAKTRKPTPSLPHPSLLPSLYPPRLSPFSSSHLSPPGNACEARVMETVGIRMDGSHSECCSSGLLRENEWSYLRTTAKGL